MTIKIDNLSVSDNASAGTVVGVLTTYNASGNTVSCTYQLSNSAAGYFAISGNNLVTAWSSPVAPGYYSVRVRAMGNNTPFRASATFAISVAMAAPPPPAPPAPPPPPAPPAPPPIPTISVNGSTNAVVSAGSALTVSVANGPGSTTDWVALAVSGSSDGFVAAWDYLNGTQTPPSVGLSSASVKMTAPANPGS
jgi:hypothetical protein